jgi:signal transduction histidine kinase
VLRADPEQLHRVLSNLVRNARQAIAATGKPGEIRISGVERDGAGGSRSRHRARPAEKGARSPVQTVPRRRAQGRVGPRPRHRGRIIRGHGGTLELVETGPDGTTFAICLPAGLAV